MLGRQVFLQSLVDHGAEYIFGNPGSTENAVVDGMLDYPELTYVIALHESIALCAATFYAHASDKTAIINLHAAPGLGNAIGMMFGAMRANAPMVVTSGQQDTRMRLNEPVLGHDLVGMAAPVTKWSVQAETADEIGLIMHRAFKIANEAPKGPVFVALPINVMEMETENGVIKDTDRRRLPAADTDAVADTVRALCASQRPIIVAGDSVAQAGTSDAVARLAEMSGAAVWFETSRSRLPIGTANPSVRGNLPFDTVAKRAIFAEAETILLIGGRFFEGLWFGPESPFPADACVVQIDESRARIAYNFGISDSLIGDIRKTVDAIADGLDAAADDAYRKAATERRRNLEAAHGNATQEQDALRGNDTAPGIVAVSQAMAGIRQALPANAVLVDESLTTRRQFERTFRLDGPTDYFGGRGGGIGQGLAGALGVKVAYPDRPVLVITGDGSAMYSIQALWTAARHDLAIVFVVFSNREYRVLKFNLDEWRQRFGIDSNRPNPEMDLDRPKLNFVDMAKGMGVAGEYVSENADVAPAIERALKSNAPYVVELEISR